MFTSEAAHGEKQGLLQSPADSEAVLGNEVYIARGLASRGGPGFVPSMLVNAGHLWP